MLHSMKIITGAALLSFSMATSALAETVTLRFNLWLPPTHFIVTDIIGGWAAEVERVTEGRVRVENTTTSLGAPPRQYQLAVDGVADLTWISTGAIAGKFPLQEVMTLPFLANSAESASVALWRTYQTHFREAEGYDEVKLVGLHGQAPGQLLLARPRDVQTIGDIAGLKLRVGAEMVNVANALGVVPVPLPASEVYPAASRGVIEGMFFTSENIPAFGIEDYVNEIRSIPGGFYNAAFFLVMNKAAWEKIGPEDQAAIDAVSGEVFARNSGRAWDARVKAAEQMMAERGVPVAPLPEGFVEEVRSRTVAFADAWVAQADARGIDGAGALAHLREEISRLEAE